MTTRGEIYKCLICGNIVEVLHEGPGQLVCCAKPMRLFEENTEDASQEKHVPVIERTSDGYKVTVGSVLHPSEDAHYIEWIELIVDGISYREFLKPGDEPSATFCVPNADTAKSVRAREYCNLHGLWVAKA